MEGFALAAILPPWSYKSELLTPKLKHNRTLLLKVTILAKAINKDKPPILWRTAFQAEYYIGDCPGTPPSLVYQVTHGTAFQAAERLRFLFLPRS